VHTCAKPYNALQFTSLLWFDQTGKLGVYFSIPGNIEGDKAGGHPSVIAGWSYASRYLRCEKGDEHAVPIQEVKNLQGVFQADFPLDAVGNLRKAIGMASYQ